MSTNLRTTVPVITGQLKPSVIDCQRFRDKDQNIKQRQKRNFDSHHGVQELPTLNAGSQASIPHLQTKGTIQKDVSTRSYTVNTERGTDVRKNRRHLNHLPEENKPNKDPRTTTWASQITKWCWKFWQCHENYKEWKRRQNPKQICRTMLILLFEQLLDHICYLYLNIY